MTNAIRCIGNKCIILTDVSADKVRVGRNVQTTITGLNAANAVAAVHQERYSAA